jgi:nucleoside-diphosphate-sugar epimerase
VRALVTGAAGFVGSHLAEALLARGDEVVGLDCFVPYYDVDVKRANLAPQLTSPAATFVEADLRVADLDPLLDGVDVVFHQAGQAGVRHSWSDGFADYVSLNLLSTQRLLEAVQRRQGACRVVFASSSSVYGNQDRYPVVEDDLPRPYSPYGVTKLAAEHLGVLYADNWGLPFVALRYFTVYGPRQRPDMSIHRLCEAALRGTPFRRYGDGEQVREFTYVDDIVAGNLAAADADVAPGTYMNLAGGSEITLNALIATVEELSESKITIGEEGAKAGDARRNGGSTERAARLLGWKPTVALRDGIAAQLAWHRALIDRK